MSISPRSRAPPTICSTTATTVPACYFHLRDLFFGLAQLAHERPDLHAEARSLFERIAVATGRDHARAMSWFDGAVDRASGYAGQARITLASTFHYALQMGWSRPLDAIRTTRSLARGVVCIRFSTTMITIATRPPSRRSVLPRAFATRPCAPRLRPRWPPSCAGRMGRVGASQCHRISCGPAQRWSCAMGSEEGRDVTDGTNSRADGKVFPFSAAKQKQQQQAATRLICTRKHQDAARPGQGHRGSRRGLLARRRLYLDDHRIEEEAGRSYGCART